MTTTAAVIDPHEARSHYGMRELKSLYQKYAMRALIGAIALHLAVVGGYYLSQVLGSEDEPVLSVRIMKYSELGPPPSITNTEAAPQVAVTVPVAKPTVGVPVPVPDAEVSPEQTIATQQELSNVAAPSTGTGDGGTAQVQQDIKIEDEEPADFVPFEKEPIPIKSPALVYPEFARRISAEGTVWMKIWVDKEGKPKKAVVAKSDNTIFDEYAQKLAMEYVFTPAMMNNGPVAVWVTIPFRFKLNK
ncbi:MAG TPA: TonB family protein [Bacteroidota bacterium]|jgi:protein TonB|nr:TonB family protein [Bacteroidota bacterium]